MMRLMCASSFVWFTSRTGLNFVLVTVAMKFFPAFIVFISAITPFSIVPTCPRRSTELRVDGWKGDVVSNTADGSIRGCTIQQVEGSTTEWIITIDGVEADVGRFGLAIYKKITVDAKKERFEGFRPGTIPPHLEPTYMAFTMDEVARETVLEAMQQNNIRPFDSAREHMIIESFTIPPSAKKSKKKKGKKKATTDPEEAEIEGEAQWRSFETMRQAINAGWRPGQSFSFVARDVKGQKVLSDDQTRGASPLGVSY